jgi:hypothetical protein
MERENSMLTLNPKVDVWLLESCLKRSGFTPNSIEFILHAVETHTSLLAAAKEIKATVGKDSMEYLSALKKLGAAIIKAEGK